jgi:hypothetical protein
MHLSPPQSEIAVPQGDETALPALVSALRVAVWTQLQSGKPSLYSLAKQFGVSRQYLSKVAKQMREIREA